MDGTTRYSAGAVIPDTGMKSAIGVLDFFWISPFWAPESIQFDQAFENNELTEFLSLHGIDARPVPGRSQQKFYRIKRQSHQRYFLVYKIELR